MITYLGFYKGRDVTYKVALTDLIKQNAKVCIERVNKLLTIAGFTDRDASSGWRPAEVNAATPGAAKKSNHMLGLAVDVEDTDRQLQRWCLANTPTLEKLGLWMEHPRDTPTWTHLQTVPPRSGNRVFYAK